VCTTSSAWLLEKPRHYDIISLMFSDGVTKRLVAVENEQRAQKVATLLNYGQLARPSNAPSASYTGHVNNPGPDPVAVWVATFQRTDGISSTPFVDFAWDFSLAKGYYQDQIDAGYITSASGRDKLAIDQITVVDAPYEFGPGYVKWMIFIPQYYWFYVSGNGTDITINMQAISMVPGTLSLARTV